jgi:hypothetical protein
MTNELIHKTKEDDAMACKQLPRSHLLALLPLLLAMRFLVGFASSSSSSSSSSSLALPLPLSDADLVVILVLVFFLIGFSASLSLLLEEISSSS